MVKHRKPPSQTWRTFLENHVKQLVSVDFFVVPTLSFRILYVFLVLAHERRRVVHFNVTEQPTAEWAAAQLKQAFPWDTAPSYILRDRDRVYGKTFRTLAADMQITEVLTAARSPWQFRLDSPSQAEDAGSGPDCRRAESRRASPSIRTPSRINSLPSVTLDQRENSAGLGLHGSERAPGHWSPDKVFPWLIVGSSTSHSGSV